MINNIVNDCRLVEMNQQDLISIDGGNWWSDFKAGLVSAFNSVWDAFVDYASVD